MQSLRSETAFMRGDIFFIVAKSELSMCAAIGFLWADAANDCHMRGSNYTSLLLSQLYWPAPHAGHCQKD